MVNINVDNLSLFYLTMAIVGLGFAIMIAFGRTEEKGSSKKK